MESGITFGISPREGIPSSAGCFVLTQEDGSVLGYLQIFKNNTVGYWRTPMEQGRLASSVDEALKRLELV